MTSSTGLYKYYPSKFPGFGYPLDWNAPGTYQSILAYKTHRLPPITLSERWMLELMNALTDKAEWFNKIYDEEIVPRWREEAKAMWLKGGGAISDAMFDWSILELGYNEERINDRSNPPPTFVFNGDVYKSDTALSLDFKQRLQRAVAAFEASIPEDQKDWHPNTDEKVWDLVHPSLFPVVFGRSRVLTGDSIVGLHDCIARCGEGMILPVPGLYEAPRPTYSRNFQWLPCEVDISGPKASITTYVNNLHPIHQKPLYSLLEELITAAIPLWELSLAPSADTDCTIGTRVFFDNVEDPEVDAREWPDEEGVLTEIGEQYNDYDAMIRRREWIMEATTCTMPQPGPYFVPIERPEPPKFFKEFKYQGLQVIVKLANIHLTPEKPTYKGGSWHVEGQLNEHIIASAIYYYSNENITESRLSFRHMVDPDDLPEVSYAQGDHSWLWNVFGIMNEGPAVQDSGSVVTREGRLVTFPNILQHRVDRFHLQDPTKPGHRKIVALFLVNPHIKILSSAKIPCQRKDWWDEYRQNHPTYGSEEVELVDHSFVDFPLTMDEAKGMRLKVMEERSFFDESQNEALEEYTFNLCEH